MEADPILQVKEAESSYAKRGNFEADPMLEISREPTDSSYAKRASLDPDSMLQIAKDAKDSSYNRREIFKPDPMLAVTRDSEDASYAKEKRADFEADSMLRVGAKDTSSYAD